MALIHELAVYEKAAHEVLVSSEELRRHAFGEKPFVEIVVAERGGNIVGAALFYEKYSTWKGPAIHLEDLIVKELERGHGIGAALLEAVIATAKSRGYRRVYWQVLEWNEPAIGFYKKYSAHFDPEWLNVHIDLEQKQTLKP